MSRAIKVPPVSDEQKQNRRIRVWQLKSGESLPDPTTTSGRRIHGPARVIWTQWSDGGIDVKVEQDPWPEGTNADPDADWKDEVETHDKENLNQPVYDERGIRRHGQKCASIRDVRARCTCVPPKDRR